MAGTTTYYDLPTLDNADAIDGAAQLTSLAESAQTLAQNLLQIGNVTCVAYSNDFAASMALGANTFVKQPTGADGTTYSHVTHTGTTSMPGRPYLDGSNGGIWLPNNGYFLIWAGATLGLQVGQTAAWGLGTAATAATSTPTATYCEQLVQCEGNNPMYMSVHTGPWLIRTTAATLFAPFYRTSVQMAAFTGVYYGAMGVGGGTLIN